MREPLPFRLDKDFLALLSRLLPGRPKVLTKEVSVMAWIQDEFGRVLLVKQTRGGCWALPGGRVDEGEGLVAGLRREVKEELGLAIGTSAPVDVFDRPERSAMTVLFRVILKPGEIRLPEGELEAYEFHLQLPSKATTTARHFWKRAQQAFDPIPLFYRDGDASPIA
jgi:ADP-ribose pyrophosphatase YjhB (NUDIX family)